MPGIILSVTNILLTLSTFSQAVIIKGYPERSANLVSKYSYLAIQFIVEYDEHL